MSDRKMSKLKTTILTVLLLLLTALTVLYYKKDQYFEKFLRDSLKLEFTDSSVSFLTRSVTLKNVMYRVENKKDTDIYSADSVTVNFEEVNMGSKLAHIDVADIEGFNFKKEPKVEVKSTSSSTTPSVSAASTDSSDTKKVIAEPKKKKKEKWYAPFKDIFKELEGAVKGEFDPVSIIDSDYLDEIINEKFSPVIAETLNKNSVEINDFFHKIQKDKKLSSENFSTGKGNDYWIVKIDRLNITSNVYGIPLSGTVNNLVAPLGEIDSAVPIKFDFATSDKINKIFGEMNTEKGSFQVDAPNFDYKLIPQLKNYVKSGKFRLEQKSDYAADVLTIKGSIKVTDAVLNTDAVVADILKDREIPIADPRAGVLKLMFAQLKEVNIHYTYSSKDGTVIIKTDLQGQLKKIIIPLI